MTRHPEPAAAPPTILHAEPEPLTIDAVAHLLYGRVLMRPPVTSLADLDDRIRTDRDVGILLIEVVFGPDSALPWLERSVSRYPDLKILVLTAHWSLRVTQQCMEAGVRGVVAKPFARIQLFDAITEVYAGGTFISPEIGSRLDVLSPELAVLGEVTLQVLALARCGLSDKEIADLLGISPPGVQHHKAILKRVKRLPPGHTDWTVV